MSVRNAKEKRNSPVSYVVTRLDRQLVLKSNDIHSIRLSEGANLSIWSAVHAHLRESLDRL